METIRKKVNLEDAVIRLSGCTIPYISVSDDSLGKFYPDLISGSTYIKTKTISRLYSKLLNTIRNGIKLKRKSNLSDCAGSGSESIYVLDDEFDITQIDCNGISYGIHSINSFDKISDTEYETNIPSISEDSIVLIDVEEENGANEIKEKLLRCYRILFCGRIYRDVYYVIQSLGETYTLTTPYIEMPLALNQDIQDLGHMTDYQDWLDEFPNEDGISVDTKFHNNVPNPLSSTTKSITGYTTDSKLQTLRSKKLYTDDEGNLLPGLFVEDGKLWLYRYDGTKWSHSNQPASFNGKTCGDDLSNGECAITGESQQIKYYRTVSLDATVQAILSGASTGDYYYFYVKYKNDSSTPMDIPFEEGKNGIISADTSSTPGFINIIYSANDITYKETYKYNPSVSAKTTLDGFENIVIYYNEIDYEFTEQTIYNKHYDVYREGNLADITEYITADVWGKDGSMSAYTVNAPIFKEEYLLGISSAFESEIDVTINRGNAAAFERHFKLSECNTMEDLENYGNNIFNL